MPSFDVVSEANQVEIKNAVDQANKEITTRFDFKGSDARVEQKERELTAYADSEFQLGQVRDVLTTKMSKRNVDVRFLDLGKIEKIETAMEPKFQAHFVSAMAIPNKVDVFSNLAKVVTLPPPKVHTEPAEGEGGRRRRRG